MKLYIDTRDNTKTTVGLDDHLVTEPSGEKKSQLVLELIDRTLKKQKKTIKDLTEIKVETGPGSFTGLKVGVTIANVLGWVLKIPVNKKLIGAKKIIEPVYK
jgi:tRNA threonylcarbamoyladenosine biosynthesis protein TsaB